MSSEFTTSIDMLTGSDISASAGVTNNTVGAAIDVSQRESFTVQFVCGTYASGDGNFSLDGSNDGSNWVTNIAFLDAGQTTATTLATSKVLSSKSSAGAYVQWRWKYLRCRVEIAGSGTYYAFLTAN